MLITPRALTACLRIARRELAGVLLVVRLEYGDPRIAWRELFESDNGGYRGIDVGQRADCRHSTDGYDGLHVQAFADRAEAHLDERDPLRDPSGHAVADTKLGMGLALGLAAGGLLAGLVGAVAGAAAGAIAGVTRPKLPRRVITLGELGELVRRAPPASSRARA